MPPVRIGGATLLTPITPGSMGSALMKAIGAGKQEGVNAAADAKVTTGGAGLNLAVAAGIVFVQSDTSGLLIPTDLAAQGLVVGAANGSNPRIDQVVLSTGGNLSILAGTPTSGATLDNRSGAATLPNDYCRLADILVPTSFTGPFVGATHIRDRRPWANGAFFQESITGLGAVGTAVAAVVSAPRLECSGNPLEMFFTCTFQCDAGVPLSANFLHAYVLIDGSASLPVREHLDLTNGYQHLTAAWTVLPGAGSHTIAVGMNRTTGGGNLYISPASETRGWWVRESTVASGWNQ